MISVLVKPVTFEEFVNWKPDGGHYELHNGVIIKMNQPLGKHEKIGGFLTIKLSVEFDRLNLPYFIPKQALVKSPKGELGESAYSPDVLILSVYWLVESEYQVSQFRGDDQIISPTFPEFNLTAKQIFEAGSSPTYSSPK